MVMMNAERMDGMNEFRSKISLTEAGLKVGKSPELSNN